MTQLAFETLTLPNCSCCDKPARSALCQPCRMGDHTDHRRGVWDYANPALKGDPTICLCKECAR